MEPSPADVAGWLGALGGTQQGDGMGLGPALGLVLGLQEHAGPAARWVSRRRVWCTRDHPVDRAAVQVGARRGRFDLRPGPLHAPLPPVVWLQAACARACARARLLAVSPGPPLRVARALARGAAGGMPDAPVWARDREVAAVLVGADGALVAGAQNQAGEHRLLHAELVLLLGARAAGNGTLPAGCRVVVTLQPCRLCAALLVDAGITEVVYGDPEPGRFGQDTALQRAHRQRRARPDEDEASGADV